MSALRRLPAGVLSAFRGVWGPGDRRQAVFDADGTLWRGDVGEDFLRFLAAGGHLPRAATGVYAEYERLHAHRPDEAYAFSVIVMAGMEESSLRRLAVDFFRHRYLGRLFRWVRPALSRMRAVGTEVWICSASPRWIVEAGAAELGVPADRVVGVDCELIDGRLSAKVLEPVTAGAGKVAWLTRRGVRPSLAVGNGALDLEMLLAAEAALVVAPQDAPHTALAVEAARRGWPVLLC